MESPILELARRYVAAGLSVIPIRADGSKAPALAKWEEFKERKPNDDELAKWFPESRAVGVAVVCGKVSGNLAVLDFETQTVWDRWLERFAKIGNPDWMLRAPRVKTPKGGRHVYCRMAEGWVAGGKLAFDGFHTTVVEVRGQGHYVLAPGCPAACHPLNIPYLVEFQGWLPHGNS